jgi:hypothetical protein
MIAVSHGRVHHAAMINPLMKETSPTPRNECQELITQLEALADQKGAILRRKGLITNTVVQQLMLAYFAQTTGNASLIRSIIQRVEQL